MNKVKFSLVIVERIRFPQEDTRVEGQEVSSKNNNWKRNLRQQVIWKEQGIKQVLLRLSHDRKAGKIIRFKQKKE